MLFVHYRNYLQKFSHISRFRPCTYPSLSFLVRFPFLSLYVFSLSLFFLVSLASQRGVDQRGVPLEEESKKKTFATQSRLHALMPRLIVVLLSKP